MAEGGRSLSECRLAGLETGAAWWQWGWLARDQLSLEEEEDKGTGRLELEGIEL